MREEINGRDILMENKFSISRKLIFNNPKYKQNCSK